MVAAEIAFEVVGLVWRVVRWMGSGCDLWPLRVWADVADLTLFLHIALASSDMGHPWVAPWWSI